MRTTEHLLGGWEVVYRPVETTGPKGANIMKRQTFTFTLRGMTERQEFHYVESLRLGLSEFDGLAAHGRSARAQSGWALSFGWVDERYVDAFRRSSFYARLALSPNVVRFKDTVETTEAGVAKELATAA